jgi:CDP-glucose 4,6-dehydratase
LSTTWRGIGPHEARSLRLDCSQARNRLGWHPIIDLQQAISLTVAWYQAFRDGGDLHAATLAQIEQHGACFGS